MKWLFLIYIFILFILFTPNIWIKSKIDTNILYLLHGFVFTFLLYFGRYFFDIKESMIDNKAFDITVNNYPNMDVHRDKYIQYYSELYKKNLEQQNKKYAENINKAEEEIQELDNMIQEQIRESEEKKKEINKQLDKYKAYQAKKLDDIKAEQAQKLELQKKREQEIKAKFDSEYKKMVEKNAMNEINYKKSADELQNYINTLNEKIKSNTNAYEQQILQQNIEAAAQKLLLSEQQKTAENNKIKQDAALLKEQAINETNKNNYEQAMISKENNHKFIIEQKNTKIAELNATNLELDETLQHKISVLTAETKQVTNLVSKIKTLRNEYNVKITTNIAKMEGLDSNNIGDLKKINEIADNIDEYVTSLRDEKTSFKKDITECGKLKTDKNTLDDSYIALQDSLQTSQNKTKKLKDEINKFEAPFRYADSYNNKHRISVINKIIKPQTKYIKDINAYQNNVQQTLQSTINELKKCTSNPKGILADPRGRKAGWKMYTDVNAESIWFNKHQSNDWSQNDLYNVTNILYYRWINPGLDYIYVYMYADDFVNLYVNGSTLAASSGWNHIYALRVHKIGVENGLKKYGCNTFKFHVRNEHGGRSLTTVVYSKPHDNPNGSVKDSTHMKDYILFATGPVWNNGWFSLDENIKHNQHNNSYTLTSESKDASETSVPEQKGFDSIMSSINKDKPVITDAKYKVDNNSVEIARTMAYNHRGTVLDKLSKLLKLY